MYSSFGCDNSYYNYSPFSSDILLLSTDLINLFTPQAVRSVGNQFTTILDDLNSILFRLYSNLFNKIKVDRYL